MAIVVSEPLLELPGGDSNSAAVRDCTELHLGARGIQQLAGFERLVNLEVLWLQDNLLAAITGLDANTRLKQLSAHRNCIATLKGSLQHLRFLTHLDLSHNKLRDLAKVVRFCKQHFGTLAELNLQGNPCCEEPHYRLQLIHALPSLQVLDLHQVTALERTQAAGVIGGDVATLTVAFGRRVPPADAAQQQHTAAGSAAGQSVLEQELFQLAESIRDKRLRQEQAAQDALFASNPHASYWALRPSLPPPPGVLAAQAAWMAHGSGGPGSSNSGFGPGTCGSQAELFGQPQPQPNVAAMEASAGSSSNSSYVPKDVLVLSNCRKRAGAASGNSSSSAGGATVEHVLMAGTFGQRLTGQTWEADTRILKL